MKSPAIIKLNKLICILIRTTKSHAYIVPIVSSTLKLTKINLRELENYEMLEVPLKESIRKYRIHKSGISMQVYDELNKLLKGLDEQPDSN